MIPQIPKLQVPRTKQIPISKNQGAIFVNTTMLHNVMFGVLILGFVCHLEFEICRLG